VNSGFVTAQGLYVTSNGLSGIVYLPGSYVSGDNIGGGKVFIMADSNTDVIYQSAGSIGTAPIYLVGYFVNIP
jgi:hypothetical protein